MYPNWKIIYLLLMAIGLFWVRQPMLIAAVLSANILLCLFAAVPVAVLAAALRRLATFTVVVSLSYLFVADSAPFPAVPATLYFGITVNWAGPLLGLVMAGKVMSLLLASVWVRHSSPPGTIVEGLRRLRVPEPLAMSVGATLALLAGGGGGGGRGNRGGKSKTKIPWAELRAGKLDFLHRLVLRARQRAQQRIEKNTGVDARSLHDVVWISGIALAMLGLKMFQLLPGLPVAPGHKNLLMIPLFLLASSVTRARLGGLWLGATVGTISVMLGYGKFGILELAQYLVPGVLADLLAPACVRARGWWAIIVAMACGAVLGAGRFAANLAVIVLAGAPLGTVVFYFPALVSQVTFGLLSGWVTPFVLKLRADEAPGPATTENKENHST